MDWLLEGGKCSFVVFFMELQERSISLLMKMSYLRGVNVNQMWLIMTADVLFN